VILAFAGVGLPGRRDLAAAARRLGLVRPAPWQILAALAAAGALYAFTSGVDLLAHRLTPGLAHEVDAANRTIFGGLGDPGGILVIALSAGICEEILFRGALQPRLGLIGTAVLFTVVHSQYGLTLDAAAVLGAALALGLLRRYANTTTTIVCHVVYDSLVGIQIASSLTAPAIAIELALVGLAAAAWLAERRAAGAGRATQSL
jgi:membrane protease YdiL (CAAX protease family)